MTPIRTADAFARELEEARQDVALLLRLKGAEDRVKRLIPEYEKALAADEKAEAAKVEAAAAEEQAARDARFAGLRDLIITEAADKLGSGVLSSRFRIKYTRDAWVSDANATLPQAVNKSGFAALDANVFAWIVEKHPEKVPASIMTLAPHDIGEAFHRYFVGLQRGYLAF
jgi:hypothetical protein